MSDDGYVWVGCGDCGHEAGLCQSQGCRKHRHAPLGWPSLHQQGCICPPTSEQTCMNPACPRRGYSAQITTGTTLEIKT